MLKNAASALLMPLLLTACNFGFAIDRATPEPAIIQIHGIANNALYNITLKGNASDELIMPLDSAGTVVDVAWSDGVWYAATFTTLLKLDEQSKTISTVGAFGPGDITALARDPSGKLYAAGTDGSIYTVETSTGATTKVMTLPYHVSGDVTFDNGSLSAVFATVRLGVATDTLIRTKLTTQETTVVGDTGFVDVQALDMDYFGKLYGRTAAGQVLRIDKTSGAVTVVRSTGLKFARLQ